MRHPQRIYSALLVTVSLAVPTARAAIASPPPYPARSLTVPAPPDTRQAEIAARHDVALAFAQLPAASRYEALGQLDGAEIALLDGQTEYGPLLRLASPPSARSSAVSELDEARLDVLRHDAALARQTASSVSHRRGAHRGTAR